MWIQNDKQKWNEKHNQMLDVLAFSFVYLDFIYLFSTMYWLS